MNKKEKKERIAAVAKELKRIYPDAACALEYGGEPWKLLIMGRLSAQCTDARVNIVCRELFCRYPTLESVADAELSELEEAVRPCGLHKTKAKNIKDSAKMLIDEYGGKLPDSMDELLKRPGVGRKIANLLIGDIFGGPAIVADTHFIRICGRLGMYPEKEKDPTKVERIMVELVEPSESSDLCHRVVMFGREYCTARSPRCTECPIKELCERNLKTK